jgi:uncharacterized repeat protein (TIGR01451 family)/fimbrial isopeptide formation D2 family protein
MLVPSSLVTPARRSAAVEPARRPAGTARLVALVALLVVACGLAFGARPAGAAITLQKRAPDSVLLGNTSRVTLHAANAPGEPYAYNLSFRDVLPAGVSYVPGSAPVEPTIVADRPATGQTTLIFPNVSDLSPNADYDLTYEVAHRVSPSAGALYDVGDSYVNSATAYANTNPRIVPAFSATGAYVPPSGAGQTPLESNGGTPSTATTRIAALEIEKTEPSSEGEIVRGVHDHQTVYTLTITNNGERTTTGLTADDYLPAGLEFLGCGEDDHTSSAGTNLGGAEEYPGAGPIDAPGNRPAGLTDCVQPASVETALVDPDGTGPLPEAVYTHVRWTNLGALAAKGTTTIRYVAAVPLRENTTSWSTSGATTGGAVPSASSLEQGSNLGNNSGPETRDEQRLENLARTSGVYRGDEAPAAQKAVTAETTLVRTAEDLAVEKSVDHPEIAQNDVSTWSMRFRTSEYRSVSGMRVTDTLPDGLCPLGTTNLEGGTPAQASTECDPVAGQTPSVPYASADEQADGSWTIAWDLPDMTPSDDYVLTFPTRTRPSYQQNFVDDADNPVRAGDSWSNRVHVDATDHRICAPGASDCSGGSPTRVDGDGPDSRAVVDDSAATQTSGGISIDKTVLDPTTDGAPTPVSCAANAGDAGRFVDETTPGYTAPPQYGPGDRVCWKLRANFSSKVSAGSPVIRDFLPPGMRYEAGSARETAADNVPQALAVDDSAAADGVLSWNLADVDTANRIFEWTFSTIVDEDTVGAGSTPGALTGNLMKLSYENTDGRSFPLRDQVDAQRTDAILGLTKAVTTVNGTANPNTSGDFAGVKAEDDVAYGVTLRNTGTSDATRAVVWDDLPAGLTCAAVQGMISDGGTCAAIPLGTGDRITWSPGVDVPVGGTTTLTYTLRIPADVAPRETFQNHAGIVQYERVANVAGESFVYVPATNIDTTRTPNAPRADDTAVVSTPDVAVAKSVVATSVTESGNTGTQATIGERIDYRVRITVPRGTTLYGAPRMTDALGDRQILEATPAPAVSQAGGTPAGTAPQIAASGTDLLVDFPDGYDNSAGTTDAVFTVTFSTRVADATAPVNANRRGQSVLNTASFAWNGRTGAVTPPNIGSVSTPIVEPNLAVAKTAGTVAAPGTPVAQVKPGDVLRYTVTPSNATTGGNVTTGHDVQVVDTVPVGLTPEKVGGGAAADGDAVGVAAGTAGTWAAGPRTITWSLPTVAPGATAAGVHRQYDARVDDPATAGSRLDNAVAITGTSLAGTSVGERTADSPYDTGYVRAAAYSVRLAGGTLSKGVTGGRDTVGDLVDYSVDYVLPGGLSFYDLTLIDTLPDGLAYDAAGGVEVTCVGGCSLPAGATTPQTLADPGPAADGSRRTGFFLGDVPSATGDRTVRLTYRARIRTAYVAAGSGALDAGDTLVNRVQAFFNATNAQGTTLPAVPADPTAAYTDASNVPTAQVTVAEPEIALDKHVSGTADDGVDDRRDTQPGDTYTYEVRVKNTGTSPAYDVDVSDSPDADRLRDIELDTIAGVTNVDGDGTDGDLAWNVAGPIAPGATVTLTYTAKLAPSSALSPGDAVVNTAAVPEYWGSTAAEHAADPTGYRSYTESPSDTVTLDVRLPELGIVKTTGGAGFPEAADAQVGEAFEWRIVVANASGGSTAKTVAVRDVLPEGWTYVAGSAVVSPAAPGGTGAEPTVATTGGVQTLTWDDLGDLGASGSRTVTLRAKPGLGARPVTNPQQNTATATARDTSGATGAEPGPYRASDTAEANLRLPALAVTKTPDGANVVAGEGATYELLVRNTSSVAPARDVVVTDVLGAQQRYEAGTATAAPAGGFAEESSVRDAGTGATTTTWRIDTIPADGVVTISVPVAVSPSVADATTLVNGASAVSREVTTPATDDGSLRSTVSADVGIEKTVTSPAGDATAGTEVAFALKATNHGPSDAAGVTVTDTLPATLSFVSAPGCTAVDRTVTCAVGALANGADRTFIVTAKVASGETTEVRNTARVTTTSPDPQPANDEDEAVKTVSALADIVVGKSASKDAVKVGEGFTYTVSVENRGASDAVGVTLDDPLPAPGIRLVAVRTDIGTCTPTDDALHCDIGRLEPGAKATVTVGARGAIVGSHVNRATATTTTAQSDVTNDAAEAEVDVLPLVDLAIVKRGPATVDAAGTIRYELDVQNRGPSDATGVQVQDVLPAGTTFAGADPGCAEAGGTVRCAVGDLAVGDSRTIHVDVVAPFAVAGRSLTNVATVRGDQVDPDPTNDSSQATTRVGPAADLSIEKTAGGAVAGGQASWTIIVRNAGPTDAQGVVVRDALPAGTAFSSAAPSQGDCTGSGAEATCRLGTMPSGAAAQITVVADVEAGATGRTLRNTAAVGSDTPDPDTTNGTASADVVVAAAAPRTPRLRTTKVASTGRPVLGRPLTYRITVTNEGEAPAMATQLVDTMSAAARVDRVRTSQGTCQVQGTAMGCRLGVVPPGAAVTVTTTVTPVREGDLRNTATAITAGQDPAAASGSSSSAGVPGRTATADVTVRRVRATASLTKRASRRTVGGGGDVVFTMRARMGTGAAGANVRVCDRLPRGLVFVKAAGARIRGARACWTLTYMAAGSTRTFRITARAERGPHARTIRNVATLTGANVRSRRAAATVRVRPVAAAGASGGVTG